MDAALVAGDPCFDRMLAGRPLRESYRRRFGVHCGQRLVLVSSTWGEDSLYARDPDLVPRLARRLPLDEYRLVVALHPNIWYAHTPWQVRNWTERWRSAGVVVLPPEEGWRAALVAADLTIGDHGSVTFYSAALGNPLLLAAAPLAAVDGVSPIARLLRTAPRLESDDLREQVDAAISGHDPARYSEITEHTTSVPGESARVLRSTVYEHLELDEPEEPAETTAPPLPAIAHSPPLSQIVHVELDSHGATATRLPADALREPARLPANCVLVTSTDEPSRRWLECAEVLLHDDRLPDPQRWIRATLAGLPGAMLAATRDESGRWVAGSSSTPAVRFSGPDELAPAFAAYLRARITAGTPAPPSSVRLRLGPREARFETG